jgi:hypothetical protein
MSIRPVVPFEQGLVQQLREIAKTVKEKALPDAVTGIVGSLADALTGIVDETPEPACTVFVTLKEDHVTEDWLVHPDIGPAILFEMAGRLQAIALRLISMADQAVDDHIDHVGHGCALDPTSHGRKSDVN